MALIGAGSHGQFLRLGRARPFHQSRRSEPNSATPFRPPLTAVNEQARATPDAPTLALLVHDAERVIDHQIQAIEELDDKSEHMISLAVALLAAGVSLATIVVTANGAKPHFGFFWVLLAGGLVNLVAIMAFLESYIGFRGGVEVHRGPSLRCCPVLSTCKGNLRLQ